ncbi:hypothetical protein RI367_003107 [Sorochytrium milnesiophthora]
MDALVLYRQAVRAAMRFPIGQMRAKLLFNIREVFEMYRHESSPRRIAELTQMGKHDVDVLVGLCNLEPAQLNALFRATPEPRQDTSTRLSSTESKHAALRVDADLLARARDAASTDDLLYELVAMLALPAWKQQTKHMHGVVQQLSLSSLSVSTATLDTAAKLLADAFYRRENADLRKSLLQLIGSVHQATSDNSHVLLDGFCRGFADFLVAQPQSLPDACDRLPVLEVFGLVSLLSSFELGEAVLADASCTQLAVALHARWLAQCLAQCRENHETNASSSMVTSTMYNLLKSLAAYLNCVSRRPVAHADISESAAAVLRDCVTSTSEPTISGENQYVASVLLVTFLLFVLRDPASRCLVLSVCVQPVSNEVAKDIVRALSDRLSHRPEMQDLVAALRSQSDEQRVLLSRAVISVSDLATLQHATPLGVSLADAVFQQTYTLLMSESAGMLDVSLRVLSFETLTSWLDHTAQVLEPASASVLDANMDGLLALLWANYDEPLDALQFRVKQAFVSLVKMFAKHPQHFARQGRGLDELLHRLCTEDPHRKARYGMLEALIPSIGARRLVQQYPTVVRDTLAVMDDFGLAGKAANVLRALLASFWRQSCTEHPDDVGKARAQYHALFMHDLISALTSSDEHLAKHVSSQVLDAVLTIDKDTLPVLLSMLNAPGPAVDCQTRALLSVLRLARSRSLLADDALDAQLSSGAALSEAVGLASPSTRLDLLCVICESKKVSSGLSEFEIELLQRFLRLHVADPSPEFRKSMYTAIERLLHRVKNSLYALHRESLQTARLLEHRRSDIPANELAAFEASVASNKIAVERSAQFLSWLVSFCVASMFNGASYARLMSALSILKHMAATIGVDAVPMPAGFHAKHCAVPEFPLDTSKLLRNDQVVGALLEQTGNAYEGVRLAALDLLLVISHPLPGVDVQALLSRSMRLLNSSRPSDSHSGALLMQLVVQCFVLKGAMQVTVPGATCQQPTPLLSFVGSLVSLLDAQREAARQDLVAAAQKSPSHGTLAALAHILGAVNFSGSEFTAHVHVWQQLALRILGVIRELYTAVADVLCDQAPEGNVPHDYREMEEAIDALMGDEALDDRATTSQQILSFAWRTVKESSNLVGVLTTRAPLPTSFGDTTSLLSFQNVEACGDFLRNQMASVRHRGAFSSIYPAFVGLSSALLSSSRPALAALPKRWLSETLMAIRESDGLSITRRSAGLPYIVLALVVCDASRKQFLPMTMRMLHDIASETSSPDETSTVDLPQVHALNILRRLFEDAKLGQDVRPYTADALTLSIDKLSSPIWAVRNCAMMLFTALVNRVFGSKKRRDEHHSMNKITAKEFFHRYPTLHGVLLGHFSTATASMVPATSGQIKLPATLHPVLILLSRLHPSPLDTANQMFSMDPFVPLIEQCSASSIWKVREMAAKAMAPLVAPADVASFCCQLVAASVHMKQNQAHGALLQVLEILGLHAPLLSMDAKLDLCARLGPSLVATADANFCPLVKSCFLQIVPLYAGMPGAETTALKARLQAHLFLPPGSASSVQAVDDRLAYAVESELASALLACTGAGESCALALQLLADSRHYEVRRLALKSLLAHAATASSSDQRRMRKAAERIVLEKGTDRSGGATVATNDVVSLSCSLLAQLPPSDEMSMDTMRALWQQVHRLAAHERTANSIQEAAIVYLGCLISQMYMAQDTSCAQAYTAVIDRYSHEEMPLALREAAVGSLQRCRATVLFGRHEGWIETSVALRMLVLRRLLQDDDVDLRAAVCEQVVRHGLGECVVTNSRAIELMYQHLRAWAAEDARVARAVTAHMRAVLALPEDLDVLVQGESDKMRVLFAKEDNNLYKELELDVQMAVAWMVSQKEEPDALWVQQYEDAAVRLSEAIGRDRELVQSKWVYAVVYQCAAVQACMLRRGGGVVVVSGGQQGSSSASSTSNTSSTSRSSRRMEAALRGLHPGVDQLLQQQQQQQQQQLSFL